MYKLGIRSILDDIIEIKRRLQGNFPIDNPTSNLQIANKRYVDNADTSPVFYEQEAVGYEGEIVQWQT